MNRRELIFGTTAAVVATALPILAETAASRPPASRRLEMYEVGGQTLFPQVNANGSYIAKVCCFPFYRDGKDLVVYGYYNTLLDKVSWRDGDYDAHCHEDAKASFMAAIGNGVIPIDREDGGLLPLDGEIVRLRLRRT